MLVAFGSGVALEIVAVLEIVPLKLEDVWTTTVIVALPPAASEAMLHVMVPVPPTAGVLQENPAPEAETNVVFAGTVSVTETACAALGPALLTAMV